MKKLILILVMMVMIPSIMKADEIVVGTATDNKNAVPFLNSYPNSWMEMIYTAEEIGPACTIGSIAFQYVAGPTLETNDLRIYLAETDRAEFASKSDWTPESELTLVYSGNNVVIGDEEWETFKFDTPFEYSGEKNLAVVVAKTAGYIQLTLTWACYNADKATMFTASDTDPAFAQYPTGDALAVYGKKAVMKLIEPAKLDAPTNLRAAIRQDVPDYDYKFEITVAWDAVEGAKGYDVYVNTEKVQDFQMGYTNGTAYVIGTNQETTFEFYVVAFNDETESDPSEIYTVVVEDDAIEEVNVSFNVYPNPVNDKLYIETEATIESVTIYTVTGAMVGQQTTVNGQQTLSIDVTNLNSGVYFMKVVTENGEAVQRFIKK
jgi:hypothetical protein